MTGSTRLRGVRQPAAWAAMLLIAAGCTGNTGATASPTSVTPVTSTPTGSMPAASTPAGSAAVAGTPIGVRDFTLDPLAVSVAGPDVVLDVRNSGPTVHNVTIRDDAGKVLGFTPDLREGEGAAITASLAPGTYVLFCSLPGHESLGIKGTLTVTAP
jgi:plastocyanin